MLDHREREESGDGWLRQVGPERLQGGLPEAERFKVAHKPRVPATLSHRTKRKPFCEAVVGRRKSNDPGSREPLKAEKAWGRD